MASFNEKSDKPTDTPELPEFLTPALEEMRFGDIGTAAGLSQSEFQYGFRVARYKRAGNAVELVNRAGKDPSVLDNPAWHMFYSDHRALRKEDLDSNIFMFVYGSHQGGNADAARNDAKALRIALDEGVAPEQLPEFIKTRGGLRRMLVDERAREAALKQEAEEDAASDVLLEVEGEGHGVAKEPIVKKENGKTIASNQVSEGNTITGDDLDDVDDHSGGTTQSRKFEKDERALLATEKKKKRLFELAIELGYVVLTPAPGILHRMFLSSDTDELLIRARRRDLDNWFDLEMREVKVVSVK